MRRDELVFERPDALSAREPPEARGVARDRVRLLVSDPHGDTDRRFDALPDLLRPGDLLVVNTSRTLPASLPATCARGPLLLNLATDFGGGVWLAEPRFGSARPGPVPLDPGEALEVGGDRLRLVAPHPRLPRLWFVRSDADLYRTMRRVGSPIRYGYARGDVALEAFQTVFGRIPGSVEMPSAGRPFSERVLSELRQRGVGLVPVVLHTTVSSLEVETETVDAHPLLPEPFSVPPETAAAVNRARSDRRRVLAVGTTVVRALESAWDGQTVRPAAGFTQAFVRPRPGSHPVDGLLTGFHDPLTSHLAMLHAVAGPELVRRAYRHAVSARYRWHEFGDSHLILASEGSAGTVGS